MKVVFYTRYSARAASARQRFYQLIPGLQSAGFDIQTQFLLGDSYLQALDEGKKSSITPLLKGCFQRARGIFRQPRADLAIVQYELWPYMPTWLERMSMARSEKWILDFDDAFYLNYARVPMLKGKLEKLMRHCSAVTAGSSNLVEYARQFAPRVEYFPTAVNLDSYTQRPPHEARDEIVIGWMGSPTTATNLRIIQQALAEFSHGRNVRLRCVGAGAEFNLPGVPMERRPWLQREEVDEIQQFDIGINPLVDTEFTRGKCGYKLIQYMACAVPVVASPVGANCEIVEDGRNGFLAYNQDDWVTALRRLADDHKLRQRFGQEGRAKVVRQYSTQSILPRLISFFHELAQSKETL